MQSSATIVLNSPFVAAAAAADVVAMTINTCRVFQKSSHLKLFGIFSLWLSFFAKCRAKDLTEVNMFQKVLGGGYFLKNTFVHLESCLLDPLTLSSIN